MESEVHIFNAALDESPVRGGTIILGGVIDAASLHLLKVAPYQRDRQPASMLADLVVAIKQGVALPPIELGMRGQRFRSKSNSFYLQDTTFIIDGLQRITAAQNFLDQNPGGEVHLRAEVHFNSDERWERERFQALNMKRLRLAPNILLRNMRTERPAILSLFGLTTNDKAFCLYDRVCWDQRMTRGELINASVFCRVASALHAHAGSGLANAVEPLALGLCKVGETIGLGAMRDNTRAFFELVDKCWGLREVQTSIRATHLRGTFLTVLARVFSDHAIFWSGDRQRFFTIGADDWRKLAKFPLDDKEIERLASSAGKARITLYHHVVGHLNSGRRTHRLVHRADEAAKNPTPMKKRKPERKAA